VTDAAYQQLWHVTDGAVRDALRKHPDYLTPKGRQSARRSIVKRVVGTVLGFAVQAAARQRELAVTGDRHSTGDHQAAGTQPVAVPGITPPATHSHAHVSERCYQAIRAALFGSTQTRAIRKDAGAYQRAKTATTQALRRAVGE